MANATAFLPSMEVYQRIRPLALGGIKTPYGMSNPVLYRRENQLYVAFFVYTYTREDIQNGAIRRPTDWILADLVTGDLIERMQCSSEDFSDAPFTEYFSTENPNADKLTKEYYQNVYALLDTVRRTIIGNGSFPKDEYAEYLKQILQAVPPSYHRFYWELSNV